MIAALRLTDMAMEKRNARDMFRPGVDTSASYGPPDPILLDPVSLTKSSLSWVENSKCLYLSLVCLYYGLPNGINEEISRRSQLAPQRPRYSKKDIHKMGSQLRRSEMSMFYQ